MTLEVTVNGETRRMRLDVDGERITSRWGETETAFNARQVEPGVYHLLHEGRSLTVVVDENGTLLADGRTFQVEVTDPRNAAPGRGGAGRTGQVKIASPMPGKVVRVLVAAGDTVEAGQGLLVVEAMKMQNEMKAPRAATVVKVNASDTATVTAGEVLMILE